jgi:hypothetical protein
MYKETRRLDVELLADILADLDQGATALAALARIGFMAMFDAHQMGWQRLAAGARTLRFRLALRQRIALRIKFGFHRCQIDVPGLFEQVALVDRQRFALVGKADAAVMGQFQCQRGNLDVGGLDDAFFILENAFHHRDQLRILLGEFDPCQQCTYIVQQGGSEVKAGEFGE